MIPIIYSIALALAMLTIGLSAVASERHIVVMIFAIEIIFAGSIIALSGFISNLSPNPDTFLMLVSILAVASTEVITLIVIYTYMKQRNAEFDVSKLSKMKW